MCRPVRTSCSSPSLHPTFSYSQISRAVDRLARHYSFLATSTTSPPPERVIAVLVSTAVDESLLEIALAKLGLTALLLSVNNSPAAVAHLVKQTKSSHLIYGPKFEQTAQEVEDSLRHEGVDVGIVPEKRFPLWGPDGVDEAKIEGLPPRLTPDEERMRTCVILHSSGSVSRRDVHRRRPGGIDTRRRCCRPDFQSPSTSPTTVW
jgi:acyl-coenzyme A synthetase/AMP-(fatty) acid ligase